MYTVDAKMPYPKTATSKPAPGARVAKSDKVSNAAGNRLPADVENFASGWKVKNWGGPGMRPGLRKNALGRSNVLVTHPRSKDVPCVLYCDVQVPIGQRSALRFAVNNHPKADWTLLIRIDGEEVRRESIEGSKWQEFSVDITKHAGKTVSVELENGASGWSFEAGYWHQIELVGQ